MATSVRGTFTPGEYVDVVVSYVEGPRKFYVQPLSCSNDLRSLTKRLYVLFSSNVLGESDLGMTLDHLATSLRQDAITWCAAPFHIDAQDGGNPLPTYYYRATVMSRTGPSTVKVFFVDYGNISVVPIASLKMLPKSYQEIPVMATPCRLIEGEQGDTGTNLIDATSFRTVVDGFHVVMFVSPDNKVSTEAKPHLVDPLLVSLFVTDGKDEANVGETLLTDMQALGNSH